MMKMMVSHLTSVQNLNVHMFIGILRSYELRFGPLSHTVSCVSSGGPVNTVTWTRMVSPSLPSLHLVYQLSRSLTSGVNSTFLHTLTITGGDAEDYNGTLSCTVSNSKGPASVRSLDIHSKTLYKHCGSEASHTLR